MGVYSVRKERKETSEDEVGEREALPGNEVGFMDLTFVSVRVKASTDCEGVCLQPPMFLF